MTRSALLFRLFPALALTAVLAACAPPEPRLVVPPADLTEAQSLELSGELQEAGRLYLAHAQRLRGEERIQFTLHGLELLLSERPEPEDLDLAETAYADLTRQPLPEPASTRAAVAGARLAIWSDDPWRALSLLPTDLEGRPAPLARQVLETRVLVLSLMDDWLGVVQTHITLERWQDDAQGIAANREVLWTRLLEQDRDRLARFEAEAPDRVTAGWLALARVARGTAPRPAALETALEDWMLAFPNHPATGDFLPRLRREWAELGRYPDRIAVLLPMTGRLAAVSTAVYEGMLAAYYRLPVEDRPSLRLYDTGEQAEAAWTVYHQAVQDGATLVIGPLDRRAVELFATSDHLPVPMLALNQVDWDNPPERLFQFGLNPEDEARQVAEYAAMEGYLHALILAPRNELGERLGTSFTERFLELGGLVLSAQFYAPQATDYAPSITQGLGLNDSQGRHRQLQNIVRRNLEFEPRRRQDLDVVFMVGTPREARLLAPQLRFHRAGDLPVLSTSHAYSGHRDAQTDADLDGLTLAEIPWLLDAAIEETPTRATLAPDLSPGSRQLPRLVALGHDAMRLAPLLNHLHQRPGEGLEGMTGRLYLDEAGRVHRQLHWAVFRRGVLSPMVLTPPMAEAGPQASR